MINTFDFFTKNMIKFIAECTFMKFKKIDNYLPIFRATNSKLYNCGYISKFTSDWIDWYACRLPFKF